MSTPIEIVREFQRWRRGEWNCPDYPNCFPAHTPEQIGIAIDAVLADAERFKALELAHLKRSDHGEGTMATIVGWGEYMADLSVWDGYPFEQPLAELADRLREDSR